jgi:hypothetical protein
MTVVGGMVLIKTAVGIIRKTQLFLIGNKVKPMSFKLLGSQQTP